MTEREFYNWIRQEENRKAMSELIEELVETGDYYDGNDYEDDIEYWLEEQLHERVYVESGVEKVCWYCKGWDHVYKLQVNTVSEDYDDFFAIAARADEAGFGDLFVQTESICEVGGCTLSRQERAKGEYVNEDECRGSLSEVQDSYIENNVYNNEAVIAAMFAYYADDDYVMKFATFLEEEGVNDIHLHNFMVDSDGKVHIFDASYC